MALRRQHITGNTEIFVNIESQFGLGCYHNHEKIKKVRNFICRHIRSCCGYKKVIREIVEGALSFFILNTTISCRCNAQREIGLGEHYVGVLTIAAHLCQKYDIKDDPNLESIVFMIFQVDGGFDRFINFLDQLVFPHEIDPMLYQMNGDEIVNECTERHLPILDYFLREAGTLSVEFRYTQLDLVGNGPPYKTVTRQVSQIFEGHTTSRVSRRKVLY